MYIGNEKFDFIGKILSKILCNISHYRRLKRYWQYKKKIVYSDFNYLK